MKLTTFLLLISLASFAATGYSQAEKVTVQLKDASMKNFFSTVEEQTSYKFLYRDDAVENMLVSLDVVDKPLDKILTKILDGSKYSYKILENNLIVIASNALLQQIKVMGTVTGMDGIPIPGVNVTVTGTTIGVITDIAGKYSIEIPQGSKSLTFSFIGMATQEISIGTLTQIDVKMVESSFGLEEVVVVGYGTQKKVNLTGAVSAVKIDESLTSRTLTNVSSGLTGLVAGLAVTQSSGMAGNDNANLIIRGMGTINSTAPLIVVDGMPDVDINRINMNDVESVSVLKDAASSAVYGSRAANGVILITTKSGKEQGKTKINFSSSYAGEVPTKAYDFMADYPRALTLEQRLAAATTLPANFVYKNGTIDQWMALGMINPLAYPNTDWWKWMMRNGAVQNYNLSASGSNDKSNFYISVGAMDQTGLQINNDYSRYNARFNYDYKVRSNMNVGIKFAGNWSKYTYFLSNGFTGSEGTQGQANGYDMRYAIAGITPYDPVTGYYGGSMAYGEDPQAYNPYTDYINQLTHRNRQEANTSIYGDWTPVKGLTARIDYALNYYNQFQWNASTPNQAFNFQTNSLGSRVSVGPNAPITNATNTGYKTQLNGSLNYHTTIAEKHNLNFLFVYSEEYWYDRYEAASRNDRLYPTLHEIDAALPSIQTTAGNSNTEGLRSFIGRINYTAYDKYLFEANCRYDGSSRFLPGSQYGLFPSVALGWRFTQEDFLKSFTQSWLSSGKLRVSYGSLGNNSGVGRYEQQPTLGASPYIIGGTIVNGFISQKMTNVDLTWESTTVLNIGLDLGFLKNRLTTEIDYYDRLTTGMNQPSSMSNLLSGAYTAPRINIGNLRNKGIEGNFTWKDKVGDFNYSVNLNASFNRTNLEKWSGYLGRGTTFLNMPYHFLYGYVDKGIAKTWEDVYNATPQSISPGDLIRVDLNGDGKIDGNDMKAYPNIQQDRPTTNFGMTTNLSWKGFDLSVLLQGSAGRKDYWLNDYNSLNFATTRYASSWEQWNNPWSVSNPTGIWPRLGGSGNGNSTTFWLDDMSYLRLKNVQIGYNLPNRWLSRIGVDNVRIYATAENLVTFTKFRGLDPAALGSQNDNLYPVDKSFTIGINLGL
jgi:TonB-linked outer membrane protein, SusC/RagA family/TonB-dependent outer membrane receptor, SusC/RagA subfamily, signature region